MGDSSPVEGDGSLVEKASSPTRQRFSVREDFGGEKTSYIECVWFAICLCVETSHSLGCCFWGILRSSKNMGFGAGEAAGPEVCSLSLSLLCQPLASSSIWIQDGGTLKLRNSVLKNEGESSYGLSGKLSHSSLSSTCGYYSCLPGHTVSRRWLILRNH